jgi:hypothetical protein
VLAKNNSLLGVGGQRSTVSRSALRGGQAGGRGGADGDARERKQDLLRRLREKQEQRTDEGAQDKA